MRPALDNAVRAARGGISWFGRAPPRAAGCGAAERAAVYKNGFLPRAMVPFFEPHVTGEMIAAVTDALRNEKLVMGESVYKFEEEFARYIGVRCAVSVNSGNSALFLSLRALGIGPGKRAATSTNSFVASATSISAAGAEPVLCDIDGADGGMDVSSCGRADALVPVHIYGNPCDWDSVRARAEEWGGGCPLSRTRARRTVPSTGAKSAAAWAPPGAFRSTPPRT